VSPGGEHRAGRDERDEREGDQQRDDDPGGLREQHLHALAGDELQAPQAEGDRARLGERHVGLRAVVEPQQREVGGVGPEAEPVLHLLGADVHASRARQREGDVVG
jgi:hypothetical protein